MNCWYCNHELIWGGDHDIDEEDDIFEIETNLSCPSCKAFVLVFKTKEEAIENDEV